MRTIIAVLLMISTMNLFANNPFLISPDNGKTWSRRMRLPEEIFGPIKNKPELLANGELICPTSTENNGWQVHMEFTSDRGKTWERTEPINRKLIKYVVLDPSKFELKPMQNGKWPAM